MIIIKILIIHKLKDLNQTNLSINEWKKILRFSRKKFKLICTPFDEESINRVLKEKFDFLKIASCSANDWPFLEYLSKKIKKKKVICSLGGLEEDQISEVVSFLEIEISMLNSYIALLNIQAL